jgi:large subunit ribosomal protein L35
MKTKKAVKKRFKVTGKNKLKYSKPGRRHIMTKKTSKRKRNLRKPGILEKAMTRTILRMLGRA